MCIGKQGGGGGSERFLLRFSAGVRTIEYWGARREGISVLKVSNDNLPIAFFQFQFLANHLKCQHISLQTQLVYILKCTALSQALFQLLQQDFVFGQSFFVVVSEGENTRFLLNVVFSLHFLSLVVRACSQIAKYRRIQQMLINIAKGGQKRLLTAKRGCGG